MILLFSGSETYKDDLIEIMRRSCKSFYSNGDITRGRKSDRVINMMV